MTGRAKKRVEVNERKMTNGTEKLLGRAKEAALQSWLDRNVFDVAHTTVANKGRVMRDRRVMTWKSTSKAEARLCVLGCKDPALRVHRDSPTLSAQAEALILQCVASNKWKLVTRDITAAWSGYLPPDDVRNILKFSQSMLKLQN